MNKLIFVSNAAVVVFLFIASLFLGACSFDYGAAGESGKEKPDIIMESIEYVRVRKGDPLVRFKAERAERWEDRQTMDLKEFTFEQMEDQGDTVNADGWAKAATVQLETGDVALSGGVRISIDSEDVIIKTEELEWKDKEKILFTGHEDEVEIERSDGTIFTGRGFSADARSRTWSFSGEVKGTYVEKDEDEGENEIEEEN
jgi:LPS export ABC transporter protein LptC